MWGLLRRTSSTEGIFLPTPDCDVASEWSLPLVFLTVRKFLLLCVYAIVLLPHNTYTRVSHHCFNHGLAGPKRRKVDLLVLVKVEAVDVLEVTREDGHDSDDAQEKTRKHLHPHVQRHRKGLN